jgi:hypothetical protein
MNDFKPVIAETETNRGQKLIASRFHSLWRDRKPKTMADNAKPPRDSPYSSLGGLPTLRPTEA